MDSNALDLLKDRRWMNYKNAGDRRKPEYTDGVNAFLDFAFANAGNDGKIRCPCVHCYLENFHDRKVVFYHLLARGILKDYNPWTQHGEDEDESAPYEDHVQVVHEAHLPSPCRKNLATVSHGEKVGDIRQGEKENRDIHQVDKDNRDVSQANGEVGNTDTPSIPSSVWRNVNGFGMVKGGDANEERDDYDNADDVNAGRNFVAAEAGQMPAELGENSGPVKVDLPAHLGRVVGPNAQKFMMDATCLLKQTLPPNVGKWIDHKPEDVAKLLQKVKERFIFPNESHVDNALLSQFKRWFRSWRFDLRKNYHSKFETNEERLANRPPDIAEAQWKWLVDYWSSEKFKKLSETNSRIRGDQKNMTCLDQKSIARCTNELEKEQSQHDPVPSDGSSNRKRSRCSKQSIFEGTLQARVQCNVEQGCAEREAQIEKEHPEQETQARNA